MRSRELEEDMMRKAPLVTKDMIAAGLRRLGLRRGDRVMVHSSLSSFGEVEEGAYGVIDALMEVVGPGGTLLFPTFNHGREVVFDVEKTPSYNGRITETFRHMSGVLRGVHPTHAYAAWGADAQRYLRGSHLAIAWGPDSPLGRLIADGGWILLLGVEHHSSTAQHHGETCNRVKCFGLDTVASFYVDGDGEVTPTVAPAWRSGTCPYSWRTHEARTRFHGAVRDGHIGAAHVQLFRGSESVRAIGELLRGETGVDHCATCDQHPWPELYEEDRKRNTSGRRPSRWSPR